MRVESSSVSFVLITILSIALISCSGDSSLVSETTEGSGDSILVSETTEGGGDTSRIKWNYDVGSDTYIYYSSVALSTDEKTIYVGTSKKIRSESSRKDALLALNNDGSLKWKYSLSGGEEVRSSPVVADNIVCFTADYRTGEFTKNFTSVICLNEEGGSLLFEKNISNNSSMSSAGLSKVVIDNGKVFALMEYLYVFDAKDGSELYKSNQLQTYDTYINPVVLNNEILFILNNQLYFVSTETYETRIIDISSITTSTVLSTPSVDSNQNIYFGTEDGNVVSIDINGNLLWKKNFNPSSSLEGPYIRSSAAIDEINGLIYVGTKNNENSKLVALNISTGEIKWEYQTGGDVYSSPLIGNTGRIYVGSESRYLYAFNSDGTEAWKVGVSQDITWPSPAIDSKGVIYIGGMGNGSSNGKIYAIQTDSYGLMPGVWSKIHKNNQNTGNFNE